MPAPIYLVNLSSTRSRGRAPLTVAFSNHSTYSISQLPANSPAIVYLVGHALPDVLFDGDRQIREDDLAKNLFDQRHDARTLIVGDVCYAESLFDKIKPQSQYWAYVPSCAKHELSWHDGDANGGRNETRFSRAFARALEQSWESWEKLQAFLREETQWYQTPQCLPHSGKVNVSDFFYPSAVTAPSSSSSISSISSIGVTAEARGR
jgi:hypothetical protein